MSANSGSATPAKENAPLDKGKGKENAQDVIMGEEETEDDTSEDEVDEALLIVEENDEDNMEAIDLSNIISGGRTRGRQIDFVKAAEELPEEDDEEDEDDDDFEEPVEDDKMGE